MEMRFLGASGLHVSVLGFGTMTLGDGKGRFAGIGNTSGEDARRQIDICLDAGVNLFDSADVYSAGRSEQVLGEALSTRRKDVVIATKAFGRTGHAVHDIGLSRRHLIDACETSLRNLGTDWIDLYQVHSFDGLVPVEETLRALDDLVASGKVRYLGCSNHAAWQLAKALGVSERRGWQRYVGQQIQYSLLVRDAEREMLPCGIDQGVGALVWGPLAEGYLSGKFRGGQGGASGRLISLNHLGLWQGERSEAVLDTVLAIANQRGVTASQVAINWVKSRAGVSAVLIGARLEAQLIDNLGAAKWSLDPGEIAALDQASRPEPAYPGSHHRLFGAERHPEMFAHDPAAPVPAA